MTTVTMYRVHVRGAIWEPGFNDCAYDYPASSIPQDMAQVKAIAGDFSVIHSARVEQVQTVYTRNKCTITRRVVRKFGSN